MISANTCGGLEEWVDYFRDCMKIGENKRTRKTVRSWLLIDEENFAESTFQLAFSLSPESP